MGFLGRLRNVFRKDRLRREIDEELADHLACALEEGRGQEAARRALGSSLRHREASLDARVWTWLDTLCADAVFAWRQLRRRPVVAGTAMASLALAIGAAASAFQLVDAVLLRPLPVHDPGALYVVTYTQPDRNGAPGEGDTFSYRQYGELAEVASGMADLAAVSYPAAVDVRIGNAEEPEKVRRQFATGNYFALLGLRPALGRLLRADDNLTPAGHPVAVLSHGFWQRRYGGAASALGSTMRLGEDVYTVIGVAPAGFTGTDPGTMTELFLPAMQNARAIGNRGWGWLRFLARLQDGISPEALRARLQVRHRRSAEDWVAKWPAWGLQKQKDDVLTSELRLHPAGAGVSTTQKLYRQPLWTLSGVVFLVLLIACANVANLLAAFADARRRELAVRVSIGASRARLLQMVMVECFVLGAGAMAAGAVLALWMTPQVMGLLQLPQEPVQLDLKLGLRGFLFSAGLTIGIALLLAVGPALRANSMQPGAALRGDGAPGRRRFMLALVAAQVAFCFTVHFVTGLFVATLRAVTSQPAGFTASGVSLLETYVQGGPLASRPVEAWRDAAEKLRLIPSVQNVSLAGWGLLGGNVWSDEIQLTPGVTADSIPYFLTVDTGWLDTMKIPLLAGRDFTRHDEPPGIERPGASRLSQVIVNEAFAKQYFGGENPVGRRFFKPDPRRVPTPCLVVGYVANFRYRDVREPDRPIVLVPFAQTGEATFTVRGTATADALRQAVRKSHPEFFVTSVEGQDELVRQQTVRERLLASLSAFFSLVALVLAGVGLYGVLHYTVQARRREIGIRLALGAGHLDVSWCVGAELLLMVALGAGIGLFAGFTSERVLAALLFGVEAQDIRMIMLPLGLLAATAVLAATPPILSALRTDPARTLRADCP